MWLRFDGALTGVFGSGKSVYSYSRELGERLRDAIARDVCDAHIYSSILHELISSLFSLSPMDSDTVATVKSYIDYNYMGDISVSNISDRFGFERSYLYRIFKKRYDLSIKEYITEVRMRHAKEFLADGMSVGETARLVGYVDEFNFSKAYKKHYNKSPKADKCK
jgi:AraC-like DNA-binding protein